VPLSQSPKRCWRANRIRRLQRRLGHSCARSTMAEAHAHAWRSTAASRTPEAIGDAGFPGRWRVPLRTLIVWPYPVPAGNSGAFCFDAWLDRIGVQYGDISEVSQVWSCGSAEFFEFGRQRDLSGMRGHLQNSRGASVRRKSEVPQVALSRARRARGGDTHIAPRARRDRRRCASGSRNRGGRLPAR
jgi:hypothetical protein